MFLEALRKYGFVGSPAGAPPLVLTDPVLGQPDATTTDAQEDILFHIDKFIDSRWFGRGPDRVVKYRVRWLGYKAVEDT